MKNNLFGKLLAGMAALCLILSTGWAVPAKAAATPNYIASIGVSQDGSSGSTGINDCKEELSGHIIIDRDLNAGAGGDYVYMGYKTTTDPSQAIRGIVFRVGGNPPDAITYNGYPFYLVGGKYETNTAKLGGYIDLNGRAGGVYIYTYVTRAAAYGAPLTAMTVSGSSSESNYITGTNTSGNPMNLNQEAGGGALYLHYQRFSGTVQATYYHLTRTGERTSSTLSATVKTHTETMTETPPYYSSIKYDGRTFTLKGWREDNTAGAATTTSPSVTYMTTPKTYRAVYSADLRLSHNDNGGSGGPLGQIKTQYINAGSSSVAKQSIRFDIQTEVPTHADKCAFLGWSTSSSATSASYAPGGSITISSDTTLYAVWKDHSYTDNVCTACGKINPAVTPAAYLSKNGKIVGAYTTLDAAVTAAEKCTAADKAVLQLQQDIALGSAKQTIEGGVFTLDLNGFELSNTGYGFLSLTNSANMTVTDSGMGGAIRADKQYAIRARDASVVTINGGTIRSEGSYAIWFQSTDQLTVNGGVLDSGLNGISASNGTVTITGGTVTGNSYALASRGGSVTITGGSFTGTAYSDILKDPTSSLTLSGCSFPGGVKLERTTLNAILAEGQAYWAGDTMIVPAADQTEISDMGDITVKAACKHEDGTKWKYNDKGDVHSFTYFCCGAIYSEAHSYSAENGLCLCGHANPDAAVIVTKNGAVVGAYTTLDEAITVAEKCTAADKTVVQLQQSIDLDSYQDIDSGVFTIDLNGYTISGSDTAGTLNVGGVGTDVTITSSREGGTVSSLGIGDKGIETSSGTHITVSGITVIAEYDGIKLNGDAFISNVTIEAGGTGIFVDGGNVQIDECKIWSGLEGIFSGEGGKLQVTDCTIEAGLCAVSVSSSAAEAVITGGSMTGGRMTGFGNGFADIDASGEVTVSGTTFPDGVKVTKPLSDILAEGQAYWAGDRMIVPADGQMEINDMGDITVKPACKHEGGEKQDYVNNGDDHNYTYSCCGAIYTEAHAYSEKNGLCPCGHINPEATVMVEGAQNAWFVKFTDALAAWTDGTTLKLLEDVTYSKSITIPADESRTLDLNGKTWTSELATVNERLSLLVNQGALTITDTSSEKTGAIMQNAYATDMVSSTGDLTIQGGRLQSSGWTVNLEGGTAVFSGGEIVSTGGGYAARLANASLTVSGTACVENTMGEAIGVISNASLNVTGGTIRSLRGTAVDVGTNASAVISGGTISGIFGVFCYGSVTLAGPVNINGSKCDFYFFSNYPDARIIADFDMSGVQTPYVVVMDTPREFAVKTERGTLSLQAFTESDRNKNNNDKIVATETGLAMIPCQHEEGFDENGVCLGCRKLIELPLLVEDVFVTSANCGDVLGDGTVRFDFATKTLHLNNAHIEGDLYQGKAGIGCNDADIEMDLKIHLTGENTVSCKGYFGIYSEYDCIITGDGSLTVTGTGAGLLSYSDMTISAQVNVSCVDAFDGLCFGVCAQGDLTVTKGGRLTVQTVLAESATNTSIYSERGAVSNYGKIVLTGGVQSIMANGTGVCGADAVSPHKDGVCLICGGSHEGSSEVLMVTLPASLTVIEKEAFLGTAMKYVKLAEGALRIEERAFADSALAVINLPESVEFIADDAFEGCDDLVIDAVEGSYAYQWAAQKGHIAE